MRKMIFIVFFVTFCGYEIQAQNDFAKNGAYLELIGNGGLFSINYERILSSDFSIRAGFGSYSGENWIESIFEIEESIITVFPILANYFYGKGRNRLELGAGILLGTNNIKTQYGEEINRTSTIFDLTAVVGYRYQDPEGGIIFRAGFTPFLALSGGEDAFPKEGFSPSFGVSVGYAF